MRSTTVVVIGAGQAGLAMSHHLTGRSIDHVLLEREDVASTWRTHWDSLRLLSPNWMSRLPGGGYRGSDPHGFMAAPEVADMLAAYQRHTGAPVERGTEVHAVRPTHRGYRVLTSAGEWRCRAVVIATGTMGTPALPGMASDLPAGLQQVPAATYRNPGGLAAGDVLVVGASASGVQLADELRRSGRRVTLAVGEHVRLPRRYRGRDIHAWMHDLGVLDQRAETMPDLARARRVPSPQLVGTPEGRTLDLSTLAAQGVRLVGRLAAYDGRDLQFSGSFARECTAADLKMHRLLDLVDEHIRCQGLEAGAPDRPAPTVTGGTATRLAASGFSSVLWATGNRPQYPWLDPRLLDRRGQLRHHGGVLAAPGLFALGLPFTRRRSSAFLHGVGSDAGELVDDVAAFLHGSGLHGSGLHGSGLHGSGLHGASLDGGGVLAA